MTAELFYILEGEVTFVPIVAFPEYLSYITFCLV